jgi:hypothetical protein
MSSFAPDPGESFADVRPDLVSLWGTCPSNPDLGPKDVRAGANLLVLWRCPVGHQWGATVESICHNVAGEHGCQPCRVAASTAKARAAKAPSQPLAELYPHLVPQWHPTKNLPLTPQSTPSMRPDKVWWKCRQCEHDWSVTIRARRKFTGCPKCARSRTGVKNRARVAEQQDTVVDHPPLLRQWSTELNHHLDPATVPVTSGTLVWWQCDSCPERWQSSPYSRIRKGGRRSCPACILQVVRPWNNLATIHPHLADEWHPTRNGDLRPADVSAGYSGTVWWLGKCGHEWRASAAKRVAGAGCRTCPGRSRSAVEVYFEYEMATVLPVDVTARRIEIVDTDTGATKTVEADIVIPELRLVLEFDGPYSHQGREEDDRRKTALLEGAGWRVIRFRGAPLVLLRKQDVAVARHPTGFDLATAACRAIRDDYPKFATAISAYLTRTGPAAAESARAAIQQADARRARNSRRAAGLVTQPDDWSDERLRAAYEDDRMSLPLLATASGYPQPLLRQVLIGIGVKIRSGVPTVGNTTPEEIVALYTAGATIGEIQAKTGITQPRASAILKKAGVTVMRHRPKKPGRQGPNCTSGPVEHNSDAEHDFDGKDDSGPLAA